MITAEQLKTLTTFTAPALQRALGDAGKDYELTGCKFLGLTNGGQFCYNVVYKIDAKERDSTKVFLTYNPAEGRVIADIS
jgi:hypothetical protein